MSWQTVPPPYPLVKGAQYAADLKLDWEEKLLATPTAVSDKFAAVGFTNLTVNLSDFRVEGTWEGKSVDSVTLPPEVTTVWVWQP
jgi:hypothetical protein